MITFIIISNRYGAEKSSIVKTIMETINKIYKLILNELFFQLSIYYKIYII